MTHLLDTCVCVSLLRRNSAPLRRRIEAFEVGDLGVSAVTATELRYGADKSLDPPKNHGKLEQLFLMLPVVAFDEAAASEYGGIRAELERLGTVIGPLDLMIAAHGRALGLKVVTTNYGEFSRVRGLEVEDWS